MDPTIICPNCNTEIKLTESLAAPLIQATRQQFEKKLVEKDSEMALREQAVSDRENKIEDEKRALHNKINEQVTARLEKDRAQIIKEESEHARRTVAAELENKKRKLEKLEEIVRINDEKLAKSQQAETEFIRKKRDLDNEKRELELTIEKRIQGELNQVRIQAQKEVEEGFKLKMMEKDQTLLSMQKKIEELKQKAEQGSQQLQGEVQELDLEMLLRTNFPRDSIEPVPKGEFGGDVLQKVFDEIGQCCGSILWESKRTKNWSEGWLPKLRDDQRIANADISLLVSQVLPREIETFDVIDGVWVTKPHIALPIATMLRHTLLQVSVARRVSEGQKTKSEMVYQYLTGPRFRQRVEALVEAFSTMQEDLDNKRKVIMRQWAKRKTQIERIMGSTVGMYGDLQGIAGKSLREIECLELRAITSKASEITSI